MLLFIYKARFWPVGHSLLTLLSRAVVTNLYSSHHASTLPLGSGEMTSQSDKPGSFQTSSITVKSHGTRLFSSDLLLHLQ